MVHEIDIGIMLLLTNLMYHIYKVKNNNELKNALNNYGIKTVMKCNSSTQS